MSDVLTLVFLINVMDGNFLEIDKCDVPNNRDGTLFTKVILNA